ncbi:MAG: putative transcription regulator containing domain [Phycisphaerales bacterium]|nr:putative transcription regulator containing domain [Phycisphaerales bacterium]
MSRVTTTKHKAADSYMDLIRRFPLRPLRTAAQYAQAAKALDHLAVRGEGGLDAGERDYLDVLAGLIEAYDDKHHPTPRDNRLPNEKLTDLMREAGMNQLQIAEVLGVTLAMASHILSGRRRITADHARRLGERFKMEAGISCDAGTARSE